MRQYVYNHTQIVGLENTHGFLLEKLEGDKGFGKESLLQKIDEYLKKIRIVRKVD